MAIVNPNIALAGTPMQVPNVLGMQQTVANTRNTLASTDIMQEEASRASESAEYNTALSRSKDALRFVNTPEQYMAWTDASFSDPVLGSELSRLGLTPDSVKSSALKQFQQPGGFQNVMQMSAANIDQLAGIMGGRASDIAKQQQAAAANARKAAQDAAVQAILSGQMGGAAPAATAQPVPPPVNTLATPARGFGANALNAPPMSAAEEIAQTYAPAMTGAAPAAAPMAAPATAPANEMQTMGQIEDLASKVNQLYSLGTPAALTAAKRLQDQIKFLREQQPDPEKLPAALQEYKFAVDQGFAGTFEDWKGSKPPLFEPEYAKAVGKSAAERDNKTFESASSAAENLPKIYDTLNQIESSDAITGFGAEILKNVERFRAQFTADRRAGKRVADTEILDAMLGSDVFPMIGALGIGARGLDTPAEREFLRQVMTGTISMDKKALVKLTEIRKNVAERAIDRYNEQVNKGKFDRFFEVQGLDPQTIEKPVFERRSATAGMTAEQQQALNWANSNPDDPRSAEIKRRLGM